MTADNDVYQPTPLELDILTLTVRLEQIDAEQRPDHWLWTDRVMGCDVPRLRGYCSADALLWMAEALAETQRLPPRA